MGAGMVRSAIHRNFIKATLVAASLPLLSGNRVPPEWQATRNVSLASTEHCAANVLDRFGTTRIERGERPEAGKIRMFLLKRSGRTHHARATLTLNGDVTFSSLWMDSESKKLGRAIWSELKKSCRLEVLGEPH
jgi:hypothetical protein